MKIIQKYRNSKLVYGVGLIGLLVLFIVGFQLGQIIVSNQRPASESLTSQVVPSASGAALVNPPRQVSDFTLINHHGTPMSLSELRGKAVLLFFGYTHCPDVCPTTLYDYTRVKAALGEQGDAVAFVFISVDSARDDPAAVAEYLGHYDEDFIGLVGDSATLQHIGAEYGLFFERENINVEHEHEEAYEHDLSAEPYFIQHTSPSFLIDPNGYLRLVYFYGTPIDVIVAGIKEILQF